MPLVNDFAKDWNGYIQGILIVRKGSVQLNSSIKYLVYCKLYGRAQYS